MTKGIIRKGLISAALCTGMVLNSGVGFTAQVFAEERQVNADNQAYWREMLQKYRVDDQVHQVMLVRCTEGSNAIVQFYQKLTDQNDAWSLVFETDAYIGKNGTGKTGEGDAKTPLGDFGVLNAFGILENPGTALDYIDIVETTYACDEEGEYYNQIIDTEETGHECTGEQMFLYTPEYNYGIATDFNAENEWPNGSAIFLHCKGAKVFTGGCIAINEACMKTVLQYADPGMRIIIHEEYADQNAVQEAVAEEQEQGIDYMALVNKLHPLPDRWEDALETVTVENSVGDEVEVEAKAYDAYALLKADLEANDGIYVELDSARRSIAEQQDIMDRFTEKYGADYAAKTVAVPGYSEHHTGLALDLYFRVLGDDGEFEDVYYNEDMEKPEYTWIWDTIHEKLADYGFILRYLEGEEHITGYRYEPWHIRYVDDVDIAREIMSQPGLTLEEYLAGQDAPDVEIDLGGSELYTEEELNDAMLAIKCKFASWENCELHTIRYAGDEANNEENLAWLNSLEEGTEYTQVAEFLMDFHSPVEEGSYSWNPDTEYTDYQWWLARPADGDWEIITWGY